MTQLPPGSDDRADPAGVLESVASIVRHIAEDLDCVMADLESLHRCLGGPPERRPGRLAAMAAQLRQWRESELYSAEYSLTGPDRAHPAGTCDGLRTQISGTATAGTALEHHVP